MGTKQTKAVLLQLGNPSVPMIQRTQHLIDILCGAKGGKDDYQPIVEEVFSRLAAQALDEKTKQMAEALEAILHQLESTPMRPATFVHMADIDGSRVPHALTILDNGELAYVVAHDQALCKKLRLGDRVMLDAHTKILVHPSLDDLHFGGEAKLERVVDNSHIEVIAHQDERAVLMCGPELVASIKAGKVTPGAAIVMGAGGKLGVYALPPVEGGLNYYRYLDRGPVPNVSVDRDIGSPPKVIAEVALHVREEMTRPELRRKFRLRPCITRLLAGVSGCGKTLARMAIHRQMYEIMADVTGTPIAELPPRVFHIRSSQMLSMWFGESDKQIDRMFDEVEQLADKKFTNAKGKEFNLPVMVVLEEADGLGRARGQDNVYDRIMTVILQRLDPNRDGLSSKLVVFLSTTNNAELVDPAFLRRIGGRVENFGRLDQKGFNDVLRKHVDGLPTETGNGSGQTQKVAWNKIISHVDRVFFDAEADRGVVELLYQGSNKPVIKYRRDFVTPALIDRAVQDAASEAWGQSIDGNPDAGISTGLLLKALDHQVLSVVHQLHPQNIHNYTDLPDGVKVASVKRIPQEPFSVGA